MYEWRSNLTLIPQNGFILDDTIKNNITFGEKFDIKKFDKAIEVSQLKDFIDSLDLKEKTIVRKKGTNYLEDKYKELKLLELYIRMQK